MYSDRRKDQLCEEMKGNNERDSTAPVYHKNNRNKIPQSYMPAGPLKN